MPDRTSYTDILKSTLGLDQAPIAAAILPQPPQGVKLWRRKTTACFLLQIARRSGALYCAAESIVCGGRAHLGLGEPPMPDLADFLANKEKLTASPQEAHRMLEAVSQFTPPDKRGGYLAFAPLDEAPFKAEVVLFMVTPLQASRIVFLDAFQKGVVDTIHGEPFCSGTIATPITTGKIGLSLLDMSCRTIGKYQPHEMALGVPAGRLKGIVDSIEKSIAGTAEPDIFPFG